MKSQKKSHKAAPAKTPPKAQGLQLNHNHFGLLILVLGAALIIATLIYAVVYNNNKPSKTVSSVTPANVTGPTLYLSPTSQNVRQGGNLTETIWADTFGQKVNVVEADLSYSPNDLQFASINADDSAFKITAPSSNEKGLVKIARGNFDALSGKLLVGTVNFTVLGNGNKTAINFTGNSLLVSATSNTNILAATYGGNYTLSQ